MARVVVLAEGDLLAIELLLDEVVAVEVIRRLEGKERRHTHDHGTEDFIADVEVVMGKAALLAGPNAVVGIPGREFRCCYTKARPLLHALEDEVDAVSVPSHHLAEPGLNIVLLAHALLGPRDRNVMIAGECL